jgi:hypothetical protein
MRLNRKTTDKLIKVFALIILLGITVFFICTVRNGSLTFLTHKEDYKNIYAYTESYSQQ